jgi:PIN domain nuclease of toxin-antitoxin system
MRLLLDTVTFLWAAKSPERISRAATSALKSESTIREISVISLSEIAIKSRAGKLAFDRQDVLQAIADLRLRVLAYTTEHTLGLFDLPLHHGDPFDRQIIAQALGEGIPVVTADRMFRVYEGLEVVW